jgi:hypothetical protein
MQHDFCETPRRPILRATSYDPPLALYFKPRCKLWSCPYCARQNAKGWALRAKMAGDDWTVRYEQLAFVTLTSHERLGPAASLAVLPSAWGALSARLRRYTPGIKYLMIPERHQSGRVHLHAITSAPIGTRWWKDNARSCGMGYQDHEDVVKNGWGAWYYTLKYLLKGVTTGDWPKGFRRVRTSRHFPQLPPGEYPGWQFSKLQAEISLADEMRGQAAQGLTTILLDERVAWAVINLVIQSD